MPAKTITTPVLTFTVEARATCPSCRRLRKAAAVIAGPEVTLTCRKGHTWTRPETAFLEQGPAASTTLEERSVAA